MIRKSNIITINLSDYSIAALQSLGYLNKQKKSTGKGTSRFVNHLIGDFSFSARKDNGLSIRKKLLAQQLNQEVIEVRQKEERIEWLVNKIQGLGLVEDARKEYDTEIKNEKKL